MSRLSRIWEGLRGLVANRCPDHRGVAASAVNSHLVAVLGLVGPDEALC